jgi:hypothetical protein
MASRTHIWAALLRLILQKWEAECRGKRGRIGERKGMLQYRYLDRSQDQDQKERKRKADLPTNKQTKQKIQKSQIPQTHFSVFLFLTEQPILSRLDFTRRHSLKSLRWVLMFKGVGMDIA